MQFPTKSASAITFQNKLLHEPPVKAMPFEEFTKSIPIQAEARLRSVVVRMSQIDQDLFHTFQLHLNQPNKKKRLQLR